MSPNPYKDCILPGNKVVSSSDLKVVMSTNEGSMYDNPGCLLLSWWEISQYFNKGHITTELTHIIKHAFGKKEAFGDINRTKYLDQNSYTGQEKVNIRRQHQTKDQWRPMEIPLPHQLKTSSRCIHLWGVSCLFLQGAKRRTAVELAYHLRSV